MTSRAEQKTRTRQHLLDKAINLFEKHGFLATTTAEVARAARLSHGAVFVHFPSRDALITEAVAHWGSSITRRLHDLAAAGGSLAQVLAAHVQCLEECESLYFHLLNEQLLLPREAQNTWLEIQSAISFHLSHAAQREMAQGKVRRMPLHLLFNTWIGLLHHYLLNRHLFAPGGSVLKTCGQELLNHYCQLLAA